MWRRILMWLRLLARNAVLAAILISPGCALDRSKVAPFAGAVMGGTTGAALGNVPGAAIGTTLGYGSGVAYDWAAEPKNQNKIEMAKALSEGDIAAILEQKLAGQRTGQENFIDDIKKVLIYAAAGLAIYLTIPLLYAKKCQKEAEKNMTRPPFPKRHDDPPKPSNT